MASIVVLAKGFAVTRESAEFQVVVPNRLDELRHGLEQAIGRNAAWPAVIESMSQLTTSLAVRHRCALLSNSEIMIVTVCPTVDIHQRPTVVAVAVNEEIDWDQSDVAEIAAKCHSISVRLARSYSEVFPKERELSAAQLREGHFLSSRTIELVDERAQLGDWPEIVGQIRIWNGVRGLATRVLVPLGANVVLGTEHEAEMERMRGHEIDGYLDHRRLELVPIGHGLTRFVVAPADLGAAQNTEEADRLRVIEVKLDSFESLIRDGFVRLAETIDAGFHDLTKSIRKWLK